MKRYATSECSRHNEYTCARLYLVSPYIGGQFSLSSFTLPGEFDRLEIDRISHLKSFDSSNIGDPLFPDLNFYPK